ncbi:glycosyltransferase family 39 protein [Paenibacillus kandeliae]|uniref:glycosyltransferase family 39 protein n=1 Tax=Paenibacillus kandeliae TaxID=3231269 RepID=UPI003459B6EF
MQSFIQRFFYGLLIFFVALFIVSCFFVRAEYIYAVYADNPLLESQRLYMFIPLIIVMLLLSVVLYRLCLKLNAYRAKTVIPLVLIGSFLLQLAIIFIFPRQPTDDSQTVLGLAMNMLYNGDYSTFEPGGYLHMFPFNYSIVLYLEALLAIFPDNYLVIKIFNILFMLLTTLMIYLIYKQINPGVQRKDYGVLVFAATFIPALFMNNLIYNDVIGTALLTTAFYFGIKFIKQHRIRDILVTAVLLAVGNYFRSIGIIFLLAIVITMLLRLRSIGVKKVILSICIMGALFSTPALAQNALLQATGKVQGSVTANSAPIYMWLNMGINLERFGFWDNMASYQIYQRQANYNKAESSELFKQSIEQKLSDASFGELAEMYYKKLIWTWTEGTYQLERYGIGSDNSASGGQRNMGIMGSYSYTNVITDLFTGNSGYRTGTLWIAYTISFLMYCFALVRLIGSFRAKRYEEVSLVLVLLGFIGFYLLWEIKSRYLFPVYPLLILLSYMGFRDVFSWAQHKQGLKWLTGGNQHGGEA